MSRKSDEKLDHWLTAGHIEAPAGVAPHHNALEKLVAGFPSQSQLAAIAGVAPHHNALEKLVAGFPSQSHLAAIAAVAAHHNALEKLIAAIPSQSHLAAIAGVAPHHNALDKLIAGLPSQSQLAAIAGVAPHHNALDKLIAGLPSQSQLAAIAGVAPHWSALENLIAGLPSQGHMDALGEIDRALRKYNERFYLPSASAAASLSKQLFATENKASWRKYLGNSDALQSVLLSMTHPWADAQGSIRSVSSLAELGALDAALSSNDPFGKSICYTWRRLLGDWRDSIALTPKTTHNFLSRSRLYADLGLDEKLTDFPAPAFAEAIEITKIRSKAPTLLTIYGPPIAASHSENEESEFARTNMAHDWLQRFETQLRRFIDKAMTNEFGPDWPKRHLPTNIYEDWQHKKLRAEKEGTASHPLIAYADFTHYEIVICRRQNWPVFASIFHRQESIRESLQRLYLPRISTMHARPLTPEDELLLYAEIKRLARALEKNDEA